MEQLIDIFEAARLLGVSRWTLESMKSRREIPTYKIGRRKMFKISDLEKFVEENKIEAKKN